MPLTLPDRVETPEDMVRFFMFLDRVDRTGFHPDDRFYSHGQVQYSDRDGVPSYSVPEAKKRDRLMSQSREVAHQESLDIHEVVLFVTGSPDNPIDRAPEWLQQAFFDTLKESKRKHWDPRGPKMKGASLGGKGDPAKLKTSEYLYHVTTADRLPAIADKGLVRFLPSRWDGEFADWSAGKIFFTMDLYIAGRFMVDELEREFSRGETLQLPVLLRVHRKAIRDAREDMLWFNVYVTRTVPPEHLAVWVPERKTWVPLLEAYRDFEGKILGQPRSREEFDQLRREFFQSQPEI